MGIQIPVPQVSADYRTPQIRGGASAYTNNSGIIQALEGLKTAGAGVRIPVPNYAAGTNALGQGLMDAGKVGMAIVERQQQMRTLDKQLQIEAQSSVMQAQLQTELRAIKDPSQWVDHVNKRLDEFEAGINTEGMDERGAKHIREIFMPTLRGKLLAVTQGNAAIEQENQTRRSLDALIKMGVESKDPVIVAQAYNTGLQAGLFTQKEYEYGLQSKGLEISSRARRDLMEQMQADFANGDNGTAIQRLKTSPDSKVLTVEDKHVVKTFADTNNAMIQIANEASQNPYMVIEEGNKIAAGVSSEFFSQFKLPRFKIDEAVKDAREKLAYKDNQQFKDALDSMANGNLKTIAQLHDPEATEYLFISPTHMQLLEDTLTKQAPKADTQEFLYYASEVSDMPRAVNASPLERARIADWQTRVKARFTPEQASMLLDMQQEHWAGSPASATSRSMRLISDVLKDGYFGNYMVPYDDGFRWWGPNAEPTPLSPRDQARTKLPDKVDGRVNADKINKGETVENVRLKEQAEAKANQLLETVVQMGKEGKTEKEIYQFTLSEIATIPLPGATSNANTLFPSLQQKEDNARQVQEILRNLPQLGH